MKQHIILIDSRDTYALARLRADSNWMCAEHDNRLWLKAVSETETALRQMILLPALTHYLADAENRLFPQHGTTPVARLPELDWKPVDNFIALDLPVSAMPGEQPSPYHIQLKTVDDYHEAAALLTTLAPWNNYADTAASTRLNRLLYAANADGDVLIMGDLLPPLPGQTFWLSNDILIPSGYDFDPPLLAEVISVKMNASHSHYLLFGMDGAWQPIAKTDFVTAARSSIRLTGIRK